jgi:hypothetical protein
MGRPRHEGAQPLRIPPFPTWAFCWDFYEGGKKNSPLRRNPHEMPICMKGGILNSIARAREG